MKALTTWNPASITLLMLVFIGVAMYMRHKAIEQAKAMADAAQVVNPTNHDNVFNRAFEGLYQMVTGSTGTPGGDLYDWQHDLPGWW